MVHSNLAKQQNGFETRLWLWKYWNALWTTNSLMDGTLFKTIYCSESYAINQHLLKQGTKKMGTEVERMREMYDIPLLLERLENSRWNSLSEEKCLIVSSQIWYAPRRNLWLANISWSNLPSVPTCKLHCGTAHRYQEVHLSYWLWLHRVIWVGKFEPNPVM